jgi:NUMOD3 motif
MQVVDASIETESTLNAPSLDIDMDIDAKSVESVPKSKSKKVKVTTDTVDLGPVGHPHSEESKARISAANKGKVPWNVGKKHSEETKARIAEKTKEAMLKRRIATALELGKCCVILFYAILYCFAVPIVYVIIAHVCILHALYIYPVLKCAVL